MWKQNYASQTPLVKHIVWSGHINKLPATKMHLDTSMMLIHRKFFPYCDTSGQFVQMRNTTGTQTYWKGKNWTEWRNKCCCLWTVAGRHVVRNGSATDETPYIRNEFRGKANSKRTARTLWNILRCHNHSSSKTTENSIEKHNPPIGEQFPFDNFMFDTGRKHKEYQTKAQKRAQQKQYQTQTLSHN